MDVAQRQRMEVGYEDDHVHLLVRYPPKVALSKLVNSLKGVSVWRLRAADLPEVRRALAGTAFWSPSYCAEVEPYRFAWQKTP